MNNKFSKFFIIFGVSHSYLLGELFFCARRLRENDLSEDERRLKHVYRSYLPSLGGGVVQCELSAGSVGGEKNAKWKLFMFKCDTQK